MQHYFDNRDFQTAARGDPRVEHFTTRTLEVLPTPHAKRPLWTEINLVRGEIELRMKIGQDDAVGWNVKLRISDAIPHGEALAVLIDELSRGTIGLGVPSDTCAIYEEPAEVAVIQDGHVALFTASWLGAPNLEREVQLYRSGQEFQNSRLVFLSDEGYPLVPWRSAPLPVSSSDLIYPVTRAAEGQALDFWSDPGEGLD